MGLVILLIRWISIKYSKIEMKPNGHSIYWRDSKRLGIKDTNDERFAITCPAGVKALHLNFGQWLVLGFCSPDVEANRIEIALLADQTKDYKQFESFDFAKDENASKYKIV